MPTIAVLVPVYNAKDTLHACLDSLLAQTFTDFALLLVDDGSTDGSGEICDAYAVKDPRITVLHKENGGVASARNTLLSMQKELDNTHLAFVDADDTVSPDYLERLYRRAIDTDADITLCLWERVLLDGTVLPPEETLPEEVLSGREFLEGYLYASSLRHLATILLWNKLYRRSCFDRLSFGGVVSEDACMAPKLYPFTSRVATVPAVLYRYREAPASLTKKPIGREHLVLLDALLDQLGYFRESPVLTRQTEEMFATVLLEYAVMPQLRKEGRLLDPYRRRLAALIKEKKIVDPSLLRRARLYTLSPRLYRTALYLRRKL